MCGPRSSSCVADVYGRRAAICDVAVVLGTLELALALSCGKHGLFRHDPFLRELNERKVQQRRSAKKYEVGGWQWSKGQAFGKGGVGQPYPYNNDEQYCREKACAWATTEW